MNFLSAFYGIAYEDYKYTETGEQEIKTESPSIDYNRLYETIYKAVFTAVKRAWENLDETDETNTRE